MLDVLVEDIAHRGRKQWYWREQRVGIWHWLLEFLGLEMGESVGSRVLVAWYMSGRDDKTFFHR